MKQYLKGNTSGKFFVLAAGFIAQTMADASQLTAEQVAAVGLLGYEPFTTVAVPSSFAVCYIRKGENNSDGSTKANKRNPSKRRFATKDEAVCHGSGFARRRKRKGDTEGTANHIGFYVIETGDPVNAEINWKTRLTNKKAA